MAERLSPPPILTALLAQLAALLVTQLLAHLAIINADNDLVLLAQGALAALLGLALRLPWWWLPVNLLFPLLVVHTLSLGLPPWLFLIAFGLLLLFNWNSARERVPLYLSNRDTWEGINQLLPKRKTLRFIDLGSGLGGTLFYLAQRHPQHHFCGIESSPLPFAISWLRRRLRGLDNVELHPGNFWRQGLGQYDVVYAFLSPVPMQQLHDKCRREMSRGGLLISNSFTVPQNPPDESITLNDSRQTTLHCWRFGNG